MTTVYDKTLGVTAAVVHCRRCHAPVYWSLGRGNGRRAQFELDAQGKPTREPHGPRCKGQAKALAQLEFEQWR